MSANKEEKVKAKASPGTSPPAVGADKTVVKALGLSGGIFALHPAPSTSRTGKSFASDRFIGMQSMI